MKEVKSPSDFYSEIKKGVVIVDFYSQTCVPCKRMALILQQLEEEYKDKHISVLKVDVEELQALASRYSILSLPTILIFVNGKIQQSIVGAVSKDIMRAKIEKAMVD